MPYAPRTLPDFVKFGPGKLKIAPVGTAEPADLTTAWNVAWFDAGYTEEGHEFTYTPSFENVEVAETLLPIAKVNVSEEMALAFAFAELTAANFQAALNGATLTNSGTGATAITKIEPLAFGSTPVRVAIGWEADDASERWVWRKCLQTGAVAVARRKGSTKATIPTTFSLEPVSASVRPFMAIVKNTSVIT